MSKGNGKTSRKQLNELYSRPLPLVLSSETYGVTIPNVYPHNPFSLVYLAWKVFQINTFKPVPQSTIPTLKVELDNGTFKVTDEEDFATLWRCGFFGKGVLSRSEPTWKERTIKKYGTSDAGGLSMEDVTKKRREERKIFKSERARLQELELKQRREDLTSEDLVLLEELRVSLSKMRVDATKSVKAKTLVEVDSNGVEDVADLVDLEYLQLQSIETFYLKFTLNVLNVTKDNEDLSLKQLFLECCKLSNRSEVASAGNKFVVDYVVYYHFRSLGWCVRSGIKFGCDMLLYKRGPPFTHAEFAIMIIPNDGKSQPDWFDMAAIARVIGTVKKNLVLVFVDYPESSQFDTILESNFEDEKEQFAALFKLFKVTEILYRRWAPGRTRD